MRDSERQTDGRSEASEAPRANKVAQGANLKLIYGLLVLALGAAIGLALLIVLPFYQRR
jgi:uncharacterized protein HemX